MQPTTFAEAMALLEATERLARSRGAQLRALSSGTKVAPESRAAEVAALAEIWRLRGCP